MGLSYNLEKGMNMEKKVNPQREDGHVDIANEITEALARTQFSGYESRILWALFRETWGYALRDKEGKFIRDEKTGWILKKTTAIISSHKWCELTNLTKSHVSDTLKRLQLRRIVTRIGNKSEWGFQKLYNRWLPPIKKIMFPKMGIANLLPNSGTPVPEIGNDLTEIGNKNMTKGLEDKHLPDTKKVLKENIKRNLSQDSKERPDLDNMKIAYKATCYLIKRILANNPRARVPNKNPNDSLMKKWVDEMERLNRIGPVGVNESENKGYNWKEIKKIIDWSQNDIFWRAHILSTTKLREKIITLENKMKTLKPKVSMEESLRKMREEKNE
jgi:phage replication O-like protein O